jgi:GNAT superfamily N-acetyltransferase
VVDRERLSEAVQSRELVEGDFPACVDIFTEAWNELHRRYGFEEEVSDDNSWLLGTLAHLQATDPHGGRIATDEGGPIAFGVGISRDRYWWLSFLFVRPRAQGRGVGRALLEELLPKDDDVVRAAEVESFQTVATALYASVGMSPRAARYFMVGPSGVDRVPTADTNLVRSEVSPGHVPEIDRLDERVLGFLRRADHRWW